MDKKPDDVKPTPELAARKDAIDGEELIDPFAYMDLSKAQKQAINSYFKLANAAGFAVALNISNLEPWIAGTGTREDDEQRERHIKIRYHEARDALYDHDKVYAIVLDSVRGRVGDMEVSPQFKAHISKAADILVRHFGITF